MRSEDYFVLFKRPNGIWYYYVYRWGKRVRRSTGEKTKPRAFAFVMRLREKGDLLNEQAHTAFTTFREFAQPFWVWETCPVIRDKVERGGHFSRELAVTNRNNTEKYLIPAFGYKVLPEISPNMIKAWLRGLPSKFDIKPQTANKQLTMLRQMLDVAVEEQVIKVNPARLVKPLFPKNDSRGCFSTKQVKALFRDPWPNRHIEMMCRLASLTGMRLGEIQGLCFDQITEDHIILDRAWAKGEGLKPPKSGRSRIVPLPADMCRALRAFPHFSDSLIFSLSGNKPIDCTSVLYALRKRMDVLNGKEPDPETGTAGYLFDYLNKKEPLVFHSFRHFMNSRLIAAGIQGETIRAMIGHEDEKMTDLYGHLSADDCDRIRVIQQAI